MVTRHIPGLARYTAPASCCHLSMSSPQSEVCLGPNVPSKFTADDRSVRGNAVGEVSQSLTRTTGPLNPDAGAFDALLGCDVTLVTHRCEKQPTHLGSL